MEKRVELNLLLDFYGALLTDHRREMLRLYVEEDMSLQEIADESGISRQGVYDSIKKCEAQLLDYENKLGLMKRFRELKNQVSECRMELEAAKQALARAESLLNSIE